MALFRDDAGKTEKPTPGRLGEVRGRGDTHLSREFLMAGVLLVAVLSLRWLGGWLLDSFAAAMTWGLRVGPEHPSADGSVPGAVREVLTMLAIVAPPFLAMLGVLLAATLVLGYGQIGFRFSTEVLSVKLERLNPVANMSRLFNAQALVRTGFSALKLAVLGLVLWLVLKSRWQRLALLHELDFPHAVAEIGSLLLTLFTWIALVVLLIAAVDVVWQRFDFVERNKMTKQEVEDERRRTEGDPMIKSRQRAARTELLKQRMMQAVPKADVVITNPTHFAVALKYERKKNMAPEVVAKGMDRMAQRIRELAQENGVPIMEDPPLARALYRAVKVGQEVPEKFYKAVAAVLSHVFRLKGRVA
jgi:flagellar biosynthetic protein FlhB